MKCMLSHPGNFLVIFNKFGLKSSIEREENEVKNVDAMKGVFCFSVYETLPCHLVLECADIETEK